MGVRKVFIVWLLALLLLVSPPPAPIQLNRNGQRYVGTTATFVFLPWQVAPWKDTSPVILLTGGAGGGKSHLAAEKLHAFCLKYSGAQALIARKVRVSLTSGTILFFEREVVGDDPRVKHVPSKSRFEYSNGSVLTYIGIEDAKQRKRLRSIGAKGGVDIAWLEEATEFEQEDFDAVKGRMRGKAAPWRQIILTTNPDAPSHWINVRLILNGEAKVYESFAKDNPHNPEDYQVSLDSMQGVEGDRLRKGLWTQATGLVYDTWRDDQGGGNVTEDAEYIPGGGDIYWGVDDGYVGKQDEKTGLFTATSHPRVFLLCQLRPTGQLCIFAESYACGKLSDNHIDEVLALPYPQPEFAAVDKSAAELKARLMEKGIYTRNSPPTVAESIKIMRGWVSPDANNFRRLLVHPRCKQFRAEMASYRLHPVTSDPVKEFDHGPDAGRYIIWTLRLEAS